ncbi:MAG TPA: RsmE family RNA methyltransferase [Acidimicrobiales bacterium]|jgi:16S rRNA (uracil1498-N3)-methyltransferase|nr:RsmE family RNA methyltransferase [Acidimicrobiales bacterium]
MPAEYAAVSVRAAAASQVFVEDPAQPLLAADDAHHLSRVLRLRAGEEVIAADGLGHWVRTRWTGAEGSALEPVSEAAGPGGDGTVQFETPASPVLTVAFAPTKGERPEWVVQKLTELGVDRIVPLISDRSVVRWEGDRGTKAVERLRRVAREAAGQCRRVWLPTVTEVVRFDDLAGLAGPGQVVLAQLSGDRPRESHQVVAVGPEGGWSTEELESGLPTVGFGLSVLRAETAAVTAGALMVSLRTGTVAAVGAPPS